MRFAILLIFLYAISYTSHAQDTIYWLSKRKLTWTDFRGVPEGVSGPQAMTMSGISYGTSYGEKSFSYQVKCYFLSKTSWTRSDSLTLLNHEQGHFDISELFARKLRKAFSEYSFNYLTAGEDLRKIYVDILQARNEMNNLYDKETDFSRDKKQQQIWSGRLKSELDKLKDCASN